MSANPHRATNTAAKVSIPTPYLCRQTEAPIPDPQRRLPSLKALQIKGWAHSALARQTSHSAAGGRHRAGEPLHCNLGRHSPLVSHRSPSCPSLSEHPTAKRAVNTSHFMPQKLRQAEPGRHAHCDTFRDCTVKGV